MSNATAMMVMVTSWTKKEKGMATLAWLTRVIGVYNYSNMVFKCNSSVFLLVEHNLVTQVCSNPSATTWHHSHGITTG